MPGGGPLVPTYIFVEDKDYGILSHSMFVEDELCTDEFSASLTTNIYPFVHDKLCVHRWVSCAWLLTHTSSSWTNCWHTRIHPVICCAKCLSWTNCWCNKSHLQQNACFCKLFVHEEMCTDKWVSIVRIHNILLQTLLWGIILWTNEWYACQWCQSSLAEFLLSWMK